MPKSQQQALQLIGPISLFIGLESYTWSLSNFQQAAQFARASGIDSLIIKVADGSNEWYGGLEACKSIVAAIKAEGVGVVPYLYSYGDKFAGLQSELSIIEAYLAAFGLMCIDMEVEWNGQVNWAQSLVQRFAHNPNALIISCLADPALQNQNEVLKTIGPAVSLWMPQVYTDYLQSVWQTQFSALNLSGFCLTYDLSSSFGSNNIAASLVANRSISPHISLWEYAFAEGSSAALCKQLISTVKAWQSEEQRTPQGWTDDGTTLTAPNGIKVVLGFREFILKHGWDKDNLPLALEAGRNPLEESNPGLGKGTWQPFRWTVLEWTPERSVFIAWAGQELLYLRQHHS